MKIKKFFSLLLFINIFFITAFADDKISVICPRQDSIPDFSTNSMCQIQQKNTLKKNYFELFAIKALENEIQFFDDEVLSKINMDNASNTNFITQKSIYELRRHQDCLEKICYKIFAQCGEFYSKELNLKGENWCKAKINDIMELEKEKTKSVILGNQARKHRSLLKQKLVAIDVRFNKYFYSLMMENVQELLKFYGKVTKFIYDPK